MTSLFLILLSFKLLCLFILSPLTIKKFSESTYFGYFPYNISSIFENLSVFLAIILKLISLLTEINWIEINFSSFENLQYDLNNFISFSNSFISFFLLL